jgi:hypothetical protein
MPKKLTLIIVVFLALALASIVLLMKGKPTVKDVNPLRDQDTEHVGKLHLQDNQFSVTLEKNGDVWAITSPVVDSADVDMVRRVLSVLKNFKMGSVISEKKDKHDSFQVDVDQALSAKVFIGIQEKPKLDILIGKEAGSFGSAYVRFPDSDAVHIAQNFPTVTLPRAVDSYRAKKIFSTASVDIGTITVRIDKSTFVFQRSSDTWVRGDGETIDSSWMELLINKLTALQSFQFVSAAEITEDIGLNNPFLDIVVTSAAGSEHAVISRVVPEKHAEESWRGNHLASVSGRSDALLLQGFSVKDLADFLKAE